MGIWDTLTGKAGAETANKAAADAYAKQQAAAAMSREAGDNYLSGMQGVSQNYQPFVQGGNAAYQQLLAGLGLGGAGGQEAFTNAYRGLPGYQPGLDRGSQAVATRMNAGPGLQSGAAMKSLQKFGSDYEDSRVSDYLSRLMGLGTQGLTATQGMSNTQGQGYTGQLQGHLGGANQMFQGANTVGQGMVAGANAEAAGMQNLLNFGGNIFGKMMGGFGSSFGK
jgi:hypothetical protein